PGRPTPSQVATLPAARDRLRITSTGMAADPEVDASASHGYSCHLVGQQAVDAYAGGRGGALGEHAPSRLCVATARWWAESDVQIWRFCRGDERVRMSRPLGRFRRRRSVPSTGFQDDIGLSETMPRKSPSH